ncbi:hypothetical protein N0V90_010324 [Kalmusia sp. IMI 367209]|nr:hypothetical protein N0V90_010324 [Kalmusia sp. IMI 367209]
MVLTIHHMEISQSERIVFLCEELGIDYKLVRHIREPLTSPKSLQSVPGNLTGKSPFLEDPEIGVALSESGAIVEYILAKTGDTTLCKKYGDKNYTDYIYWFHYANASLQPAMVGAMFLIHSALPDNDPTKGWAHQRLQSTLKHIDDRLKDNKWLAGEDFTAADIMVVYSLTTQRYFGPNISYKDYPHIVRFLKDISERPGYKKAMEKGDPHLKLLVGAEAPETTLIREKGIDSGIWKK